MSCKRVFDDEPFLKPLTQSDFGFMYSSGCHRYSWKPSMFHISLPNLIEFRSVHSQKKRTDGNGLRTSVDFMVVQATYTSRTNLKSGLCNNKRGEV